MVTQQGSPPTDPQSPSDASLRKRVCKACDRCRLKKSKCDGLSVCSRCRADNAICVFGERKKSHDKVYPKGYVEMLEEQQAQLVAGLQELYRRTQNGQGWLGAPLKESTHGVPLTHDILERLGAFKSGRSKAEPKHFEEDLSSLQQRLLANGAGFMRRSPSDSGSDSGLSHGFDQGPQKVPFTDTFSPGKLPPTPPTHTPFPQGTSSDLLLKRHTENGASSFQKNGNGRPPQRQVWVASDLALNEHIDLLNQYNSSIELDPVPNAFGALEMPMGTIAPYLSMRDWNHDVDFQSYFSSASLSSA